MNKKKTVSFLCLAAALVFAALSVSCNPAPSDKPTYNGTDAVIKGYDGYLFGADALPEFYGENLYTEVELSQRVNALTDIANELKDKNCSTVFVLVPSKLSVYSDKLPDGVKSKKAAGETRFKQLYASLSAAGAEVMDITDTFNKLKDENQLYHTASDSQNDLGGFYLYGAVTDLINEKFGKNIKIPRLSDYELEETEDASYPLTREYRNVTGVTLPNKTVTLIEKETSYINAGYDYEATAATYIPAAQRKGEHDYPRILLLDTGASEACRKFFSAYSAISVFRKGIVADETVIDRAKPEYAVIIINEDELSALPIKSNVIENETDVSAEPVINASAYTDADHCVIFGVCEKNSVVYVTGGEQDVSVRTEDGKFAVEVPIKQLNVSELSLYCKTDGKKASGTVSQLVKYRKAHGFKGVIIGKDGHLHYEETIGDYTGETLWSGETVAQYVGYLSAKADRIHEVSPNTKIIYVIAPNHLTIYPETAPDSLVPRKSDNSRLKQLIEAFKDNEKLAFLDLVTPMLEAKETAPYRLYNKTDTHWNELGAYYAYREIMNYIAADFPAAAPEPLDSFDVFTKTVAGGDMANFLEVDLNVVTEEGVYVRSKKALKSGISKDYSMNFANAWFSDYHEFEIDDNSLPTMIMYRDSFSTNLMSFMAEKFSHSVFYTMWERADEYDVYAQTQPDYIICEFVERSLGGLQ